MKAFTPLMDRIPGSKELFSMKPRLALVNVCVTVLLASVATAADWSNWRGPNRDGTSDETGLVSSWSVKGENLIWKAELTVRATPIVFDGRVCVSGRGGEDLLRHELVACFDAGTGRKLWERRYPVYNTTVPFSRVGWASLAGDPETGYVYAQNVDGQLSGGWARSSAGPPASAAAR